MDREPPNLPNTASRLIAGAASLVGDAEPVRLYMQCTESDFREYCAGRKEPTFPELDRLITLIVHEQGKIIAENRQLLARIQRKRDEK